MRDPDPLIHAPARLRIMTVLSALEDGDALLFPKLREMLEMTSGNLATHLRRLEEAGYVLVRSSGRGRASSTTVSLSTPGRQAFADYRATLLALLDAEVGGPAR